MIQGINELKRLMPQNDEKQKHRINCHNYKKKKTDKDTESLLVSLQ